MKIEQFKALDAVVKAGSFAKAANEILLITQPAVTRSIKNLEKSIGFTIFSREGYRPSLTSQGEAFYKKVRNILDEVESLSYFSNQWALGVEPEIKVCIDAYTLLPDMLKAFHSVNEECTQTQLHIQCEPLGAPLRKLLNKDCDLALLMWGHEYEQHLSRLELKTLAEIKASTVVSSDFPLLKKKGTIFTEELASYVQVIERTDALHSPAVVQNEGPQCQYWYVSDAHTKKQIILSGRSFGILPYHLIEEELAQGLLVPFHNLENFEVFTREMRLARLKEREPGPVLSKLWHRLS